MAKILISYFSDYGEAMYDAISDKLLENGNDIFRFNINNNNVEITKWGGISRIIEKKILNNIKKFNPDMILNFNNCLPINCYDVLDKNCKICLIDADAPDVAFWNKNTAIVDKYVKNYFFLGLQSYSHTMYEKYFNKKIDGTKYLYFPPATVVKKEDLKKDKNISFIGSNFYPMCCIPSDELFYTKEALELYNMFKDDYFLTFENAQKIFPECTKNLFELIRTFYCGQERLKYLQQLTDLGLVIFGLRLWRKIAYYDFEIAKCFDSTPVTTIIENQNTYNSSKISINISHPLAKTSFSWRVMDIMASSSCLLMEDKPDWRDLFEEYLSKETINTVIYKNRFDMRQKVIKLLNDEELRLRCVLDLNNAIEKNGRWELRFKQLESFLNIKLLNNEDKEPLYIFIERSMAKTVNNKSFIGCLKIENRFKIFGYAVLLMLAQIPIVDLFLKKEKRMKLRTKIDKHWR